MSHLGGSIPEGDKYTWMPDIWGWLLIEYNIRSVIDIGAGYGHNAKWFLDMGCSAYGIEADPEAIKNSQLPKRRLIIHDYTTGKFAPESPYDLAMALEFVEHVDRQYEINWLATVRPAKYFLMCHALPGQDGHHHVNCQQSGYWVRRLTAFGFELNSKITTKFRATCERKFGEWGRPTLLFFENKDWVGG